MEKRRGRVRLNAKKAARHRPLRTACPYSGREAVRHDADAVQRGASFRCAGSASSMCGKISAASRPSPTGCAPSVRGRGWAEPSALMSMMPWQRKAHHPADAPDFHAVISLRSRCWQTPASHRPEGRTAIKLLARSAILPPSALISFVQFRSGATCLRLPACYLLSFADSDALMMQCAVASSPE